MDASALVKRYIAEASSTSVRGILQSHRCATSRLSEVEVVSALVRRMREGSFTAIELARALSGLKTDFLGLIVTEVTPEITEQARALLLKHHLRAGDAVQLASCLYLQREFRETVSFAAFDDKLNLAARSEGLTVIY